MCDIRTYSALPTIVGLAQVRPNHIGPTRRHSLSVGIYMQMLLNGLKNVRKVHM